MPQRSSAESRDVPKIYVIVAGDTPSPGREFTRAFKIGRTQDCDICIPSEFVSRAHVSVNFERGQWWAKDLNSSNGLFVQGEKITAVPVSNSLTIQLGIQGPLVNLRSNARPHPILAQSVNRYFGAVPDGEILGEHTVMVRRAFEVIQKKQRWRYRWMLGVLALILLGSAGYTFFLRREFDKNRAVAEGMFYSMKAQDLNIANLEKRLQDSGVSDTRGVVERLQGSRRETEKAYDRLRATLKVDDPKITKQHRAILRVARIFGECELTMPPAFTAEVENYIKKWQSSDRLAKAVALANQKGYTAFIVREFLEQDLPVEFFYLALQESNFDAYNVGPLTRKGYAKGMWQFIPETAEKYGLTTGPLVDLPRADTNDDRQHYDRATKAAARYIKDLYRTDAQASGLLVMACYNWGEKRVLPLLQSMPANPRERNFWQLLNKYRDSIPPETYDYVFHITAAAAIGEDPRLFGFNFDNPLSVASKR